jgi:PAS domain S-box-containing protein
MIKRSGTAGAVRGASKPTPAPTDAPGPAATDAGGGVPRHDSSCIVDQFAGRIAATDGMFVTDDRQRIVAWSSAAQRMLGFSPEEAVGRTCYQVVMGREPDGHPVCGRNCTVTRNARRGRGTAAYEVVAQGRDGSAMCLSNSVLVVEGPEGAFHVIHLLREAPGGPLVARRRDIDGPAGAGEAMVETLTRRELEVLRFLAQGATIDEIADSLTISVLTARNHTANIARKLGAHSRLETVLLGMRRGLV